MEKELSDDELQDLLEKAFKKIESTAKIDTDKLSNFNNSLNWILTFTTVFFVFYSRSNYLPDNHFEIIILKLSKILFLLQTFNLILHKLFLIKYEDFKGAYLASLHTPVLA